MWRGNFSFPLEKTIVDKNCGIMLSVALRCLTAVIVGVLLIIYKGAVMPFIVQLIGVAFLLPGLIAVGLRLFAAKSGEGNLLSINMLTSLGSVAFGAWLLFAPAFFVAVLMNMLGVILLLAGVYQIVMLAKLRKYGFCPSVYYYIMPTLTVLLGIFVLFNPFEAATLSFFLIGAGAVIAGVSDFVGSMLLRKVSIGDGGE